MTDEKEWEEAWLKHNPALPLDWDIVTRECFILSCMGCGDGMGPDGEEYHYPSLEDVLEMAKEQEWEDGYCPDCVKEIELEKLKDEAEDVGEAIQRNRGDSE